MTVPQPPATGATSADEAFDAQLDAADNQQTARDAIDPATGLIRPAVLDVDPVARPYLARIPGGQQ